jgi:phage/plasmid primase-like uncharacterized protein
LSDYTPALKATGLFSLKLSMNSQYFKRMANTTMEQASFDNAHKKGPNPESSPKTKANLQKAAAEKISLYERLSQPRKTQITSRNENTDPMNTSKEIRPQSGVSGKQAKPGNYQPVRLNSGKQAIKSSRVPSNTHNLVSQLQA